MQVLASVHEISHAHSAMQHRVDTLIYKLAILCSCAAKNSEAAVAGMLTWYLWHSRAALRQTRDETHWEITGKNETETNRDEKWQPY